MILKGVRCGYFLLPRFSVWGGNIVERLRQWISEWRVKRVWLWTQPNVSHYDWQLKKNEASKTKAQRAKSEHKLAVESLSVWVCFMEHLSDNGTKELFTVIWYLNYFRGFVFYLENPFTERIKVRNHNLGTFLSVKAVSFSFLKLHNECNSNQMASKTFCTTLNVINSGIAH